MLRGRVLELTTTPLFSVKSMHGEIIDSIRDISENEQNEEQPRTRTVILYLGQVI